MAYYHHGEELDRRSGRRPHLPPTSQPDWLDPRETTYDSLPRRTKRGHNIQYADEPPSSLRRSQTTWSERSSPAQVATMPLRTRAATVTTTTTTMMPFRRGRDHHRTRRHYDEDDDEDEDEDEEDDNEEDESHTGSRRSLRRDVSPRSARHYRSTPESRKDSRPSPPESDGESDNTVSTQDGRHRALEGHGQLQRRPRYVQVDDYLDQRDEDRRRRRRRRRSNIVYDIQDDEDPTPHQSVIEHKHHPRHQSRQSSRQSSDLVGSGSSVRRGHHGRSQSVLEAPTPPRASASRPTRRRHSQVIYTEIVPPTLRRAHTASETHVTSHSTTSSHRRHSLLGAFLGPGLQGHASERHVKQVQCLICMDTFPSNKAAKLKCGHRMCSPCLKTSFKLSVKDPQQMPPKCCSEVIPLRHVERLVSNDFKKTWNRKFAEFSTRKRVYCPGKRCGEWIKPENIHREDGRKCGKCSRCKLKVCCACNGKWHGSRECPRDEEMNLFLEQAKEAGWQRCHRCKAVVELKEGCNHMTCRCGAEFCMICGQKWKTCECPWFNHETSEDDRLEDMQIPTSLGRDGLGRIDNSPPSRRVLHTVSDLGATRSMRQRVPDHYEDPLVRRLQERQDGDLARRLHLPEDEGGMSTHHRSDDHRRRAHHVSVPAPPPPPPAAPGVGFERPSAAGEYVAGVNRARGVRQDSMERRLADRLSEFRSSPGSRAGMMMPPPPALPPGAGLPMSMMAPSAAVPTMRMSGMEEEMMYSSRSRGGGWGPGPEAEMMMSGGYGPPPVPAVPEAPAVVHGSRGRRRGGEPKSSTMAGLTGVGRGMNRVSEWRNHVEPGVPGDEAPGQRA